MTAPQQLDRARARLLYLALIGGLCVATAVVSVLLWLGIAPALRGDEARLIAFVLAGPALVSVVIASVWAKPRIPGRGLTGSPDDYWRSAEVAGAALLFWVLCEGGAMIGLIGMLLTGSWIPAVSAGIGFGALVTNGPARLENRGR
jgi:hypothetical protein